MNIRTSLAGLFAMLMAACPALGQPPSARPVPEIVGDPLAAPAPADQIVPASRWLSQEPAGCNAPEGAPIAAEVYLRNGASIPFSSSFNRRDALGRDMTPGYLIQGGIRTLFYNEPADRAWVIDAGISHVSNGHDHNRLYALRVIDFTGETDITGQPEIALIQFGTPTTPGVRIRDTDRTYVNLGFGRDYYWRSFADDLCRHVRLGWDAGGTYGALSQEYNIIKHRTDVIGGVYGGLHGDVEFPTEWGAWFVGIRWEYAYTWSDILQRASDIQEINVSLTLGLRY
ncbi:MAG: hypothetical protein L0Y71_06385 [Gemmataceae bacterium]|nr:hypothetical protein [Gemmataceae bacterium]